MHLIQQKSHTCLSFIGCTRVRVQVGHMVTGFIAMGVLTHHTGDIRWGIRREIRTLIEEFIKLADKFFFTAKQLHVLMQIMLVQESRLPGVALSEVTPLFEMPHASWVERFCPTAVSQTSPHEA